MKETHLKDFSLNNIVLISSLPDMGKVGGLVTQHLKENMEAEDATKIVLSDKPWVNQKDGLIEKPIDEYLISVDKKNSIVIFSGENQPQEPNTVMELVEKVFSSVKKIGTIKLVISTGGYLPAQQTDGNQVFGVATNKESLERLEKISIEPLGKEVNSITWFNGLILGKAKEEKVDGIGLFGEITDTENPQYESARNIIKVLEQILNVKIETKKLDAKIPEKIVEKKTESPGIG